MITLPMTGLTTQKLLSMALFRGPNREVPHKAYDEALARHLVVELP